MLTSEETLQNEIDTLTNRLHRLEEALKILKKEGDSVVKNEVSPKYETPSTVPVMAPMPEVPIARGFTLEKDSVEERFDRYMLPFIDDGCAHRVLDKFKDCLNSEQLLEYIKEHRRQNENRIERRRMINVRDSPLRCGIDFVNSIKGFGYWNDLLRNE